MKRTVSVLVLAASSLLAVLTLAPHERQKACFDSKMACQLHRGRGRG